mmetsp:Transcript_23264/g.39902  ORF Transcript_23264/g.39902 Transcript_23264/m.39902 type:complete len:136 (+) Transcript_23264:67-474(+)
MDIAWCNGTILFVSKAQGAAMKNFKGFKRSEAGIIKRAKTFHNLAVLLSQQDRDEITLATMNDSTMQSVSSMRNLFDDNCEGGNSVSASEVDDWFLVDLEKNLPRKKLVLHHPLQQHLESSVGLHLKLKEMRLQA